MPADNVEIVRRSFELYTRGVEAARPTWADDAVWHDPPDFPDAGVHRGPDAVARRLEELWAILPLDGLEIEEAIPVGEDEVLLLLGFHATGGGSGVPVDQRMGCIARVDEEGKINRWRPFLSQDEAREAAGLG